MRREVFVIDWDITEILSCIMHELVLREKWGARQPYIQGKCWDWGHIRNFTPFQNSMAMGQSLASL